MTAPELTVDYRGHTLHYTYFYELADFVAEVNGWDVERDEVRIEAVAQQLDRKAVNAIRLIEVDP